jgi:hypothetical protein
MIGHLTEPDTSKPASIRKRLSSLLNLTTYEMVCMVKPAFVQYIDVACYTDKKEVH